MHNPPIVATPDFNSVIENTDDIIVLRDVDGRVLAMNQAFKHITRKLFNVDFQIGMRTTDYLSPEKRNYWEGVLSRVLKGERIREEFSYKFEDGEIRYYDISLNPVIKDGMVIGASEFTRDITGHKKAEEGLRQKHEMLKRTEAIAHVGSWAWEIETDTVTWSEELFRIFQLDPDGEAPNWAEHPKLYHSEDFENLRRAADAAIAQGKAYELELRAFRKDGEVRICKAMGFPETGKGGQVVRLFGLLQDITEHKKAEQALKESEERFRLLFNNSADAHVLYKGDQFIECNQASFQMLGFNEKEELLALHPGDISPEYQPDGEPSTEKADSMIALAFERGSHRFEWLCKRSDESDLFLDVLLNAIRIGGEKLIHAVWRDITQKKAADKALRESEKEFRDLFDNAPLGYVEYNQKGRIKRVNQTYMDMLGYKREEMFGKFVWDFYVEKSEAKEQIFAKLAGQRAPGREFTRKCLRKDGNVIPALVEDRLLLDGEKRIIGIRCSYQDITDRIRVEKELEEALLWQKEVIKAGNVGLWDWHLLVKKVTYSKEWKRQIGYEDDEITNDFDEWQSRVHPDDLERTLEIVNKSIAEVNQDHYTEFRFRHKDGSYRWIAAQASILTDDEGRPVRMLGSHFDITDRKRAEEDLQESERRFKELVEMLPEAVFEADPNLNFTFVNKRTVEITGYTKQDFDKGLNCLDMLVPEDRERAKEDAANRIQGTDVGIVEYTGIRKDGSRYPLLLNSDPIVKEGNFIGFRAIAMDITDRKRTEDALRESEEFLNRTGDMAKVGGWEVDLDTMKVIWTRTTGRIHELPVGYFPDLDEAISYYHPEDQDHVRQCVQCAIESSEPFDFTVRLITAKGRERWVRALGQPIFKSGSCVRLSGTFQDITERLKLEEELRQAHKMEAIGTLAGGIAHEFNNVLGIIMGNAELALDDVPDWNPAKASLKEIRKASFRAKEVVRQILSFARKTMTALKPVEINTIVKESLKLMRASIPAMIDIQQNISVEPQIILGDPTEIHQVVINLCTNASHAMKKKGGILEVGISEVTLNENTPSRYEDLSPGDFVKLTFKDNGEGIPPDVIEKVFEPYFTTKEFGAGSGMGLSVVYGIIKKCKGAINVESTVGEGTTVEVLLPKIEEEAPPKEKKEGELPTGSERILLVDDDPSIVNMIRQMLERMGYTVSSMTDSTAALESFQSTPNDFDLVITDMSMPKMSGDQLAGELMKIREDIPILLCTGHSDTVDEKKAREIGIKGFAMKPLDMGKLARAVRTALDDR